MNEDSISPIGAHGPLVGRTRRKVVIYRSSITDVRPVTEWLREHRVPFEEIVMGMGSAHQRHRFQLLQRDTKWRTLPQIFIEGKFVGGLKEFFAHPMVRSIAPSDKPQSGTEPGNLEKQVKLLGYGGLVPFVAGLLALAMLPEGMLIAETKTLMLGYGAVILSFLGAEHWGLLLRPDDARGRDVVSAVYGVLPALLGWASLTLPFVTAILAQAAVFVGAYIADRLLLSGHVHQFYLLMRLRITTLVVALLIGTGLYQWQSGGWLT